MANTSRVVIDTTTHTNIKVLAAKEEMTIKDTVNEMTDLYKYARQSGYLEEFRAMVEKCKRKNRL